MKKILIALTLFISLSAIGQTTIAPVQWKLFKRTFTAAEFKTLGSVPIDLLAAPGSGRGYIIMPYSINFKTGAGTAFDFTGNITVISSFTWCEMPFADVNGVTYGTAKPIVPSFTDMGTATLSNAALTIGTSDNADATAGTKTPTITFIYAIISIP